MPGNEARADDHYTFQLKVYQPATPHDGRQQLFADQLHRVTDRPHKVNDRSHEVID